MMAAQKAKAGISPTFDSQCPWRDRGLAWKDMSDCAEMVSGALAGPAVLDDLIADLLAFVEPLHAGALDSRDMDENVLAAIIGLDEAEALGTVEPFHCACRHHDFLSIAAEVGCVDRFDIDDGWKSESAEGSGTRHQQSPIARV
jgi:hypothetical protein